MHCEVNCFCHSNAGSLRVGNPITTLDLIIRLYIDIFASSDGGFKDQKIFNAEILITIRMFIT